MVSNVNLSARAIFTGENYDYWVVRMEAYLLAYDLWSIVEEEYVRVPLLENPTLLQIRQDAEGSMRNFKALSILHSAVSDDIFSRLVAFKTAKKAWDYLREEYAGSPKVRRVKLLTLKREFELLRMQEEKSIREYSTKFMNLINQIRLLREEFKDQRVVEKMMISLPEMFESKLSVIEEIFDLEKLIVAELISKLQAQEQTFSNKK
ncbi:uncharacterized protein LOC110816234 [Carica papaya]|uniref:uncharacterized protein LOC110816234 n=1 Tax=Carica papaya TaxID=3649 RepID=UPI000B8C7BA5|nr:uncharacterized protein LOC110816234 [Carica papaya]